MNPIAIAGDSDKMGVTMPPRTLDRTPGEEYLVRAKFQRWENCNNRLCKYMTVRELTMVRG